MSAPYPWQQTQWQQLQARRAAGRLAHGLLLHGPAGTGKDAFADQFAQSLLCQSPGTDGAPCGTCQACRLVAARTHPDLFGLSPEEDSKVVRVDQVRGLVARLGRKSQLGGFRVARITPADRMNTEAANSLLKTLEEPGADTVIMLVSAQPARLPATVRSRCQQLAFPVPPAPVAKAWLAEQSPGADVEPLLALANGAPLAALRLAQEDGLAQREELFADFVALCEQRGDPLQIAGKWQGANLESSLDWIGGWTCDMIRLQVSTRPPLLGSIDRAEPLAGLARTLTPSALFAQLDRVREARRLLRTAVSPQAVLEYVLIPLKNAAAGR